MKQLFLCWVLIFTAGIVLADDQYVGLRSPYTDWALFVDGGHTDNVTLAPGGVGDTIETAGVRGGLYREAGRLVADIKGAVSYEQFQNHTFDSSTLGQFVGTVSYAVIPGRLAWVVQDTYGQVIGDVYAPPTPLNRVNANYVSAGPDADVPISNGLDLLAGARFSAADFSKSGYLNPVNDESLSARIGIRGRLAKNSSISVNGAYARISYQANGAPTFDISEITGRYESRTERGGSMFEVGATQIKSDQSNIGSKNSPLARITVFHRLTPSWNFNATGSHEYRDNGLGLQSALSGSQVLNGQVVPVNMGNNGSVDLLLTQSLSRADSLRAAFDFVRPRTSIDLYGSLQRDHYPFSATGLDRDSWQVGLGVARRLRPTLTLRAAGSVSRRAVQGALPGDRTTQMDMGLDWRVGHLTQLRLGYERVSRVTDMGGAPFQYNKIALRVSYGLPERYVDFQRIGTSDSAGVNR